MFKYPIIVFEGIEASGKSSSIKFLKKYLKSNKIKFINFREPGGTNFSEKLRNLILNKKFKINKKTELLLYLAARSENYENIIKKNRGKKIIIIDRFTDSTLAYQHYGKSIKKNIITKLNEFVTDNLKPDLTFLKIVNNKNRKKRLKTRKFNNKLDKLEDKFYNDVQLGFLKLSKNKNKKYIILDTNKLSEIEINQLIKNKINKYI